MNPRAVVTAAPVHLDAEHRWIARVVAYEVDGDLWPVAVEVRLKPEPCWHDLQVTDPDEWASTPKPCDADCWPKSPDELPVAKNVPEGGLPVRLLGRLRVPSLLENYRRSIKMLDDRFPGVLHHPVPSVQRHYEAVAAAPEGPRKRGRPKADQAQHLRRLKTLDEAYQAGKTQKDAAQTLTISAETLGHSLRWARNQEPPLWSRSGRGRPGRLTPHGQLKVAQLQDPK